LEEEQIDGLVPKRDRLIAGRAPENTTELFGAMAQCSSRAKLGTHAAKASGEAKPDWFEFRSSLDRRAAVRLG